jgi:RNA polymerase-binding transcription factor DksA
VVKAKPVKTTKPVAKAVKPVAKSTPKAGQAPKTQAPKAGSSSSKPAVAKTTTSSPVASPKKTATVQVKPAVKAVTPIAKKPEIKTPIARPHPVFVPKPATPAAEAVHKPIKNTLTDKSLAGSPAKQAEKMSDKKDKKPVAVATMPEEPQKTRYSDKELEEFDQLIDEKLIVAREQLEFYLKQLEDMAENPDNKIKGLDDGLSSLESERVSSMASRQQKLIQHLENAKIRIKNKVYGICRETGKLISKERLRAVPHATLSIEAKQAQN